MNPCRKYKERIAFALVDGEPGGELKQHISECPECAAYAEELKHVCREHHQRATNLPEVEAPLRLNVRVRDAITHGGLCCGWEISWRRLLQGAGIAAAAAIVIALLMRFSPGEPRSAPAVAEAPSPGLSQETTWNDPTLAAYRQRLARSVEELEASLVDHSAASGGELLKVSSTTENLQ